MFNFTCCVFIKSGRHFNANIHESDRISHRSDPSVHLLPHRNTTPPLFNQTTNCCTLWIEPWSLASLTSQSPLGHDISLLSSLFGNDHGSSGHCHVPCSCLWCAWHYCLTVVSIFVVAGESSICAFTVLGCPQWRCHAYRLYDVISLHPDWSSLFIWLICKENGANKFHSAHQSLMVDTTHLPTMSIEW